MEATIELLRPRYIRRRNSSAWIDIHELSGDAELGELVGADQLVGVDQRKMSGAGTVLTREAFGVSDRS